MPNPYFSFKKFTVRHDRCAMKVGTDGVLLGAWADITASQRVLDVGTGTGLIALMIAQRSAAHIVAIDIELSAIEQATENVKDSIYHDRIEVIHTSFDSYTPDKDDKFDLIVSNPPYFASSLHGPNEQRNLARHQSGLTLGTLLEKSCDLLDPSGKIALILPYDQKDETIALAHNHGLSIKRLTIVYPTPESTPKRILAELSFNTSEKCIQENLIIETTRHQYTEEYINLTKEFYLKM